MCYYDFYDAFLYFNGVDHIVCGFCEVRGWGLVPASQNWISQMEAENQAIFNEISCIYVKFPKLYLVWPLQHLSFFFQPLNTRSHWMMTMNLSSLFHPTSKWFLFFSHFFCAIPRLSRRENQNPIILALIFFSAEWAPSLSFQTKIT